MEPNFRSRLSCVLWCTARHSLTRVGWPLLRQDPSHQVRRRPDRRLASSQSMRCFYSYLAPLFLFLSWSPSRSAPSSSFFLVSRERFLFLADSADVFSTVWFLTSFPIVLFADFTDVFCTEWFLVARSCRIRRSDLNRLILYRMVPRFSECLPRGVFNGKTFQFLIGKCM